MRLLAAGLLVSTTFAITPPATAATVTYHYVSQPALVSTGLLVNTGYLTIDADVLASRPSSFSVHYHDEPAFMESLVRGSDFDFHTYNLEGHERADPTFLSFENGNLVSWNFFPRDDVRRYILGVSSVRGDVAFPCPHCGDGTDDPAEIKYTTFLASLGYREGSARYADLACGGWVPGYGRDNCLHDLWIFDFFTDQPGIWTTDLQEHARLVDAAHAHAVANPPASYLNIAPIPVPAPLALALGAIASLAFVGRRRAGPRAASG